MAGLEIHALSELRDEARALLADRYARQRAAEPFLPETDVAVTDEEGVVATRGGAAVAFLAGSVKGDIGTVGFAGCAASEPEALRDLYAALATQWDVSRFAVAVPASAEDLIDPFFRLAFGCQFFWSIRDLAPVEAPAGFSIRESTPADLRFFAELEQDLYNLQALHPSSSGLGGEAIEEHEQGWSDLWDDPDLFWSFVAERDGEPVGGAILYRRPMGDLRVPENNVDLAFAATRPHIRGSGAGLALTAHVLDWARERDFRSMTTDWRSVNLLSSRFWPRRGFRPQYLRMYRAIP
ncbi:MAG TPA: GNAT family N-acetyltransferase [Gaiellaceae bacterium]|jgi:GNAT superfamily N-acetyltransferase|nr:GNAT family N-acetyltransferase [Gaiellaceae bacterium]